MECVAHLLSLCENVDILKSILKHLEWIELVAFCSSCKHIHIAILGDNERANSLWKGLYYMGFNLEDTIYDRLEGGIPNIGNLEIENEPDSESGEEEEEEEEDDKEEGGSEDEGEEGEGESDDEGIIENVETNETNDLDYNEIANTEEVETDNYYWRDKLMMDSFGRTNREAGVRNPFYLYTRKELFYRVALLENIREVKNKSISFESELVNLKVPSSRPLIPFVEWSESEWIYRLLIAVDNAKLFLAMNFGHSHVDPEETLGHLYSTLNEIKYQFSDVSPFETSTLENFCKKIVQVTENSVLSKEIWLVARILCYTLRISKKKDGINDNDRSLEDLFDNNLVKTKLGSGISLITDKAQLSKLSMQELLHNGLHCLLNTCSMEKCEPYACMRFISLMKMWITSVLRVAIDVSGSKEGAVFLGENDIITSMALGERYLDGTSRRPHWVFHHGSNNICHKEKEQENQGDSGPSDFEGSESEDFDSEEDEENESDSESGEESERDEYDEDLYNSQKKEKLPPNDSATKTQAKIDPQGGPSQHHFTQPSTMFDIDLPKPTKLNYEEIEKIKQVYEAGFINEEQYKARMKEAGVCEIDPPLFPKQPSQETFSSSFSSTTTWSSPSIKTLETPTFNKEEDETENENKSDYSDDDDGEDKELNFNFEKTFSQKVRDTRKRAMVDLVIDYDLKRARKRGAFRLGDIVSDSLKRFDKKRFFVRNCIDDEEDKDTYINTHAFMFLLKECLESLNLHTITETDITQVISPIATQLIQTTAEDYLMNLIQDSILLSIHAKRLVIHVEDIDHAHCIATSSYAHIKGY